MLNRSSEPFGKALPRQGLIGRAFQALARLAWDARSKRTMPRPPQHARAERQRNSLEDGPLRASPPERRLTPRRFEALLTHSDPDREQAGVPCEDLRPRLVRYFARWGAEDPECLADETLNRVARLLAQDAGIHGERLLGYAVGVAHRVAREMWHAHAPLAWTRVRGLTETGLTHEHLEALLARLSPDREQAGALYVGIRRRLIGLFEEWQLGVDSERLADKTIDRVARRLAQGTMIHIDKPFGYFWGVAYRVALEMYREAKRQDQAFDTFAALHHPEPEPEVDPHLPCLQKCLGRLSADERYLILAYSRVKDPISGRRRLAQELGIGSNTLRTRAHRVRRKLEVCCAHCLEAAAHGHDGAGTF